MNTSTETRERRPQGRPLSLLGDTVVTPGLLPSQCLIWKWNKSRVGYGRTVVNGRREMAHRAFYERFCCPIPAGMTLDHLCRNPSCVNWEHLEPVTPRENILRSNAFSAKNARKTHCPQGHEYDDANTAIKAGRRYCRACGRAKHMEWHRKNRSAVTERMRKRYAAKRAEARAANMVGG